MGGRLFVGYVRVCTDGGVASIVALGAGEPPLGSAMWVAPPVQCRPPQRAARTQVRSVRRESTDRRFPLAPSLERDRAPDSVASILTQSRLERAMYPATCVRKESVCICAPPGFRWGRPSSYLLALYPPCKNIYIIIRTVCGFLAHLGAVLLSMADPHIAQGFSIRARPWLHSRVP